MAGCGAAVRALIYFGLLIPAARGTNRNRAAVREACNACLHFFRVEGMRCDAVLVIFTAFAVHGVALVVQGFDHVVIVDVGIRVRIGCNNLFFADIAPFDCSAVRIIRSARRDLAGMPVVCLGSVKGKAALCAAV